MRSDHLESRSRRASLVPMALLIALSVAGCFFDTRDPEQGTGEVCFKSVPSIEEDFVFGNMDGSMECLQASTYLDQLADDFEFIPSPGAQAQYPDVFPVGEMFGPDKEELFLDRLFADADSIGSNLLLLEINPPSGTTEVIFDAAYEFRVVSKDGSAITYSGEAFYTLRQEATTWFMTRWEEKGGGTNPMGLLRGGLLQGG